MVFCIEQTKGLEWRVRMIHRDRVIMALNHQQPDRVPVDFWAVPEIWARLKSHFKVERKEDVLECLDVDIRLEMPDYIGSLPLFKADGSYYAIDGTHRKIVKNAFCTFEEYASYPLVNCETPDEIRAYPYWPQIEDYDWKSFSDKIGDHHEKYFTKVEVGGPFEMSWGLRGMEQFLIDMITNPEMADVILEQRTNYYIEFIKRAMEFAGSKIDAFYTYDDIATQSSLLISKEMWHRFIMPCHKRINSLIKDYGKKIIYHSCGAISPLIGDLVNLPIDVLNPLQPKAAGMDFEIIKSTWGEKISFHGAICIQELLPNGSPEQVYESVSKTIRTLGRKGGYIMGAAHHIQNDTPTENILAMYRAAWDSKYDKLI